MRKIKINKELLTRGFSKLETDEDRRMFITIWAFVKEYNDWKFYLYLKWWAKKLIRKSK